jgi:hypothetical protein
MKPIKFFQVAKFKHRYDFGHEWYVKFLFTDRWALLQASVSWNDYPSWPFIQIQFGSNGLFGTLFWAYKFGFDIDLISRTWNWDHLTELDEEDTDYLGMDEC